MIRGREEAIIIGSADLTLWMDKSSEIRSYTQAGTGYEVVFGRSGKTYGYSADRVRILRNPANVAVDPDARITVGGRLWSSRPEIIAFEGIGGPWFHLFYGTGDAGKFTVAHASEVQFVYSAVAQERPRRVLDAWRSIVEKTKEDDPIRRPFGSLDFVHPDSVLSLYLSGTLARRDRPGTGLVLPFGSNLSQRDAVARVLENRISVIEGPPGTGKTQTILNIVANIILAGKTVGIASFNNSAVDNVGEKLAKLGIGFVCAELGRAEKRAAFFEQQADVSRTIRGFRERPRGGAIDPAELTALDTRISGLQSTERELADVQRSLSAHRLEFDHFSRSVAGEDLPDLSALPLLKKSPERILHYLAESAALLETDQSALRALMSRISGYFRYGSTRSLDSSDTATVLELQRAYYVGTISELDAKATALQLRLERETFSDLQREHRRLSTAVLNAALVERYDHHSLKPFESKSYTRKMEPFLQRHPVILSTCHSLRASIGDEAMLDYLIIDEASQVDLLAAAPAMASARNLVVVGDLNQLPHRVSDELKHHISPLDGPYDYYEHSLLSSMISLYGRDLPRTLLREHYRCHPAIIGFSNKKFYNDELIPFTSHLDGDRPLQVVSTAEGNHMRQHRDGARSNQRELDVINDEIIPALEAEFGASNVGVATPYRRQADKASALFVAEIQADTVHGYQGREKDAIVMTTVLDETWIGRRGISFVDDPKLVNVAVSRAAKRFILVTNSDLLPTSRHLRDLIGYMSYHNPDVPVIRSEVTSVFDLLYRSFSERLEPLSRRLRGEMKYRSEDIVWTMLKEMMAEPAYDALTVAPQVLLRNLFFEVAKLRDEERAYIRHRASVDFVVYNRITNEPVLAIEVDGFAYHENNPPQRARDMLKDSIFESFRMPLLRLATTGSGEDQRIRSALDAILVT